MSRPVLAAVYLFGLVIAEAFRLRSRLLRTHSGGSWQEPSAQSSRSESIVLPAVLVGIWVLPGVEIFTPWLRDLDYTLPHWTEQLAVVVFVLGLLVRWRAQSDLGASWSHTVQLADTHALVTTGIYARIRHPLYASLVLWALAQPVLIPNLIAGWGGPVAVALVWLMRVPAEEKMMHERFGDPYAQYAKRTGRLIPRARKQAS